MRCCHYRPDCGVCGQRSASTERCWRRWFKLLMGYLEPHYKVPSSTLITSISLKKFGSIKDEILASLSTEPCVSLTKDIWTSRPWKAYLTEYSHMEISALVVFLTNHCNIETIMKLMIFFFAGWIFKLRFMTDFLSVALPSSSVLLHRELHDVHQSKPSEVFQRWLIFSEIRYWSQVLFLHFIFERLKNKDTSYFLSTQPNDSRKTIAQPNLTRTLYTFSAWIEPDQLCVLIACACMRSAGHSGKETNSQPACLISVPISASFNLHINGIILHWVFERIYPSCSMLMHIAGQEITTIVVGIRWIFWWSCSNVRNNSDLYPQPLWIWNC